jgi:hypothetical protein
VAVVRARPAVGIPPRLVVDILLRLEEGNRRRPMEVVDSRNRLVDRSRRLEEDSHLYPAD